MNMNFNLTAMVKPETEELIMILEEVLLELCAKDTK